jgi:hypothetical protein
MLEIEHLFSINIANVPNQSESQVLPWIGSCCLCESVEFICQPYGSNYLIDE